MHTRCTHTCTLAQTLRTFFLLLFITPSPCAHKRHAAHARAVLSIDVLDISGTAENDASFAHHMRVHKMRLDKAGNQIGKAEYHTPQVRV